MSVCPICLKSFDKKAGLDQHLKRKTPCKAPVNIAEPSLQNTAVSLFSGCGGDTLGLERAGFKVMGFSELKNIIGRSHIENFPHSKIITDIKGVSSDITRIEDCQFMPYAGNTDVIFAGFPCQGFSHAGKKNTDDPRNQLYHQFVRATRIIKPLFIIGENVQGLQSMKSGPNPNDPLVIDNIREAFETIGYSISYKIHEAVNFGVPQKRKRMVIIGWDNSRIKKFSPAKFWSAVEANGRLTVPVSIRSFVSSSMTGAYQIPAAAVPEDFAQYALPIEQNVQPTGTPHPYVVLKVNANLLSCCKRISPIHSEIIDMDAPAKTIICTYGHQPRLLLGLRKPDGTAYTRTLLPDELKQIQGFPASYKLLGSTSEKIIQIGNAVPPPMIEAVAKAIRQSIMTN